MNPLAELNRRMDRSLVWTSARLMAVARQLINAAYMVTSLACLLVGEDVCPLCGERHRAREHVGGKGLDADELH